jgi:hypothetical protein
MINIADFTKEQIDAFKQTIEAPYVQAGISLLGGRENAALMVTISFEAKEKWENGILQNSNYMHLKIENDGSLEMFKKPNTNLNSMRKTKIETLEQASKKINAYIEKVK